MKSKSNIPVCPSERVAKTKSPARTKTTKIPSSTSPKRNGNGTPSVTASLPYNTPSVTTPVSHSTPKLSISRKISTPVRSSIASEYHGPKPILPRTKQETKCAKGVKPRTDRQAEEPGEESDSVVSEISSILSFCSDSVMVPMLPQSPDQPTAHKRLSKSSSCSNVPAVLPSQRIESFMRESKYLYARSPRPKPTPPVAHSPRAKPSTTPPVANSARYSLRKSRSSQQTDLSVPARADDSQNLPNNSQTAADGVSAAGLSPHLKYGLFHRQLKETGGLRRSRSSVSCNGLKKSSSVVSFDGAEVMHFRQCTCQCPKLYKFAIFDEILQLIEYF